MQNELSLLVKEKINSFYKQPNQITSILRILGIVIDFVVSSGSSAQVKIMTYATDILKMKIINEKEIAEKVNNFYCLRVINHFLLYRFMTWKWII